MTTDTDSAANPRKSWEDRRNGWSDRDYFAWAKAPGINPMKVAAVVAGFAIFPPLGVAALVYFVWKSRRASGWDPAYAAGPGFGSPGHHRHCGRGRGRWTGNAAFDEHQADVMQNLRAERDAFRTFRQEQRRKRDQEAYDGFRATQGPAGETPAPAAPTQD